MWARIAEIILGGWLLSSPWLLADATSMTGGAIRETVAGLVFITLALASLFRPATRANALTVAASLVLVTTAFFAGAHPLPPAAQNDIMVGFCLLMLGVVPNRASEPPRKWRSYLADR